LTTLASPMNTSNSPRHSEGLLRVRVRIMMDRRVDGRGVNNPSGPAHLLVCLHIQQSNAHTMIDRYLTGA
jgi:hypothetical protein